MNRKVQLIFLGIVSAGIIAGTYAASAASSGPNPPIAPPYRVDRNGIADLSSAPANIPVVNSKGAITGYLKREDLFNENRPRVGLPPEQDPLLQSVETTSE